MRSLSALFLVVSLALACNKEKPAPDGKSAAESKKEDKKKGDDKADDDKPTADKKKTKQPEAPKKQPSKKADSDKLATYWKSMTEGRKATLAKKYDDAYAAFDKALVAMPDDARAISERGYARLLAKDYKGAVADLDKAVARTSDKKLLGQIYYNYGLAAEARGDAEAARAAFVRSNEYNPTTAAKNKIEGKSSCPAVIADKAPSSESKTYGSWKEAYEDARKDFEDLEAWTSESASLKTFCTNDWKKGAACFAKLGSTILQEGRLYVPTPAGKIARFDLDMVGGRCGGDIEGKIVSDEGDVTHIHWTAAQGIPVMLAEKNGEMVPCTEKDTSCMTACGDDAVNVGDLFIAKDKGESMLYIGRPQESGKDPLKVTVEMPTVTIKGKGCDSERPLAK
jgi:tetratricopeptide (TPR) repeat protein